MQISELRRDLRVNTTKREIIKKTIDKMEEQKNSLMKEAVDKTQKNVRTNYNISILLHIVLGRMGIVKGNNLM